MIGSLDTRWETNIYYDPDAEVTRLMSLVLRHRDLPHPIAVAQIYIGDGDDHYTLILGSGSYREEWPTLCSAQERVEEIWPFRDRSRHPLIERIVGGWKGREKRV